MRVLVAEDKPLMARLLQCALMSEGYSVCLAADGDEALSKGLSDGLDVIVMDVMLPRRSGFDVIRCLRAAKLNVPTIMVTARDAMSDIVRGRDALRPHRQPFGATAGGARRRRTGAGCGNM